MSIEATKSVTTIASLSNRNVISEQKKQASSALAKNNTNIGSNVSLSQKTMTLLQSSENDINLEKITQIKQAISDGKLVINSHKIADELINQILQNIEK